MNRKSKLTLPSADEDAAIARGIAKSHRMLPQGC